MAPQVNIHSRLRSLSEINVIYTHAHTDRRVKISQFFLAAVHSILCVPLPFFSTRFWLL